jgi:hypothetical protein
MTLRDYVSAYALANDIGPLTAQYLDHAVRALDKRHGKATDLADLSDELLNRWIIARLAAGKSRKTVKTQRGAIVTLWKAANDDGLLSTEPRKVRTVKVPRVNPDAYWPEEVAKLLRAAEDAPGRFPCGCRRADLLTAWLLVAYYTLLRQNDLRKLMHAEICPDGAIVPTQSKTGDTVVRVLPPDAMEAVAKIRGDCPAVFPVSKKTFNRWWKWLKQRAEVPGSQKWLRRTGATACEIMQPGSAMGALGHRTPGLAYANYVDRRQLQQRPITPPKVG